MPVDLLTGLEGVNSGILLGGFLVTPAGPCSLGGLCRRNRGMLTEIAEEGMGPAGGGADRGPLGCQSDPGTGSSETDEQILSFRGSTG